MEIDFVVSTFFMFLTFIASSLTVESRASAWDLHVDHAEGSCTLPHYWQERIHAIPICTKERLAHLETVLVWSSWLSTGSGRTEDLEQIFVRT